MIFWAVALKGTIFCSTQGDFHLSICLFIHMCIPPIKPQASYLPLNQLSQAPNQLS